MRRLIVLIASGLGAVAAILYMADYAVVRLGHNAFGTVIVTRYYMIPQKNGKTEFVFQPPEPQKCVRSLFPHGGYAPCWYLNRHPEQPTKL